MIFIKLNFKPMDHLESTTDDLRTPTSFLTTTIELTEISQRTF